MACPSMVPCLVVSVILSGAWCSSSANSAGSKRHPTLAENMQLRNLAKFVLPYVQRSPSDDILEEEESGERHRPEGTVIRRPFPHNRAQREGDLEVVPQDLGLQDFEDTLDEQGGQKRLSFDDYGHLRFGRSDPAAVKKYDDDYGHLRFGK